MLDHFLVPDGSEPLAVRTVSPFQDTLHFVHETCGEHLFYADIDPLIELGTVTIVRSEKEDIEKRIFPHSELRLGLPRFLQYLQSADHRMVAVRMDRFRILRIQSMESIPEMFVSLFLANPVELFAVFPIRFHGRYIEMEGDGIQIEPGSSAKNRDLPVTLDICDYLKYLLLEYSH